MTIIRYYSSAAGTCTYNANGALTSDTGRKISSVTWNEIDLPQTVTFSTGSTINYYYAADGSKLREVRTISGTTTTIDWCGDLVLEKVGSGTRAAKRLRLDGGYVDLASGNSARRHFVRDHLGSVRAVVNDAGTVLETDDYYPLGGPLPTGSNTALQPEKYQGKDWNTAASFNVYDFGARLYDPAFGRWISQDPMAEKYYLHSPYLFCAGNPLRFVDPDGNDWYTSNSDVDTIYYWFSGNKEIDNYSYVGPAGSVLGDFENHINAIMMSLRIGSMYDEGFSFRLANNSLGAFSKGEDLGLFKEFENNSGPEFTVFGPYHPYTRELKRIPEVQQLQKDVLTGKNMEDNRHFRSDIIEWGVEDILPNIRREAREFIGSFRYYGYMNSSFGVNNIVYDSKSRHSLFLHLPFVNNKSRSESNHFGNTYQFYIWKSKGR